MANHDLFFKKLQMIYPSIIYHEEFGNLLYVPVKGKCLIFRKTDYKLLHEALQVTREEDVLILNKLTGYGVIDRVGNVIVPFEYSFVSYESNDKDVVIWVFNKLDKMGAYLLDGTKLINCIYEFIKVVNFGMYRTELNNYIGLLDKDGKDILKCEYISLNILTDNLFIVQLQTWKWGILNKKGEFVVSPIYNHIIDTPDKLEFYTDNGTKIIKKEEFISGDYTL